MQSEKTACSVQAKGRASREPCPPGTCYFNDFLRAAVLAFMGAVAGHHILCHGVLRVSRADIMTPNSDYCCGKTGRLLVTMALE